MTKVTSDEVTKLRDASSTAERDGAVAVSKRRWLVLATVTFFLTAVGYNRACFGVVDDVYAHFYRVGPQAVDWLTLSMNAVSVLGSVYLLCLLAMLREVDFRACCLTTAVSLLAAYLFLLASVFDAKLFPLAMAGQLTMGVANTMAIAMVPFMAATWFPEREMATAVGVALAGIDIGDIAGFNVPARFLHRGTMTTFTDRSVAIFGTCLALSLLVLVVAWFFVGSKPVTAPSRSAAIKLAEKERGPDAMPCVSDLFAYLKLPLADCTFAWLVLCFGVAETCYLLEATMLGDMLRAHSSAACAENCDLRAAYLLTAYAGGSLFGGVTAGVALDRTKRFRAVVVAAGVLMTLSSAALIGALRADHFAASAVAMASFGFFNGACYTALYEIIAQHMFPCSELALGAWIVFFVSAVGVVLPLVGRQLFKSISGTGVLILQTAVLAATTVVVTCIKPKFERLHVNKREAEATGCSSAPD